MQLHVTLLDGFHDDTVTMRVDGAEVYRRSSVTSDLASSQADSVDVEIERSTARLEVVVQGGEQKGTEIDVTATPFVGVRLTGTRLEFRKSKEPIPML